MDLARDPLVAIRMPECATAFDRMCVVNTRLLVRGEEDLFTIRNRPKNNGQAEIHRKQGNKFFIDDMWLEALVCYNKSLCYATKTSEHLAIAYSNRSAVYLEMKEYRLCMENISLARNARAPSHVTDKLNQREKICRKMLKRGKESPNIYAKEPPKLSRPSNPRIPWIVDCLEMRSNEDEGRHIITNEDLRPGDIVAIEDPFVCGLYENTNYRRCTYCTKENMLNLRPCGGCTNTMFCPDCFAEPPEDFHRYECPITDFLATFEKTRFVLRLVLKAIQSFDSINDLAAYMDESPVHTVFSFDEAELNAKQKYFAVHSLTTNESKLSDMDVLFRTIYSLILQKSLDRTPLNELLEGNEWAARVMARIIDHCFMIVPQNGNILTSYDGPETEDIGGAIYPFASLLNHSCSPNVFRITSGNKIMFVVLRTIRSGEQLVDCYV